MMIPLLFNLTNKKVLVVGGGMVGARRIQTILDNQGEVICVSPMISKAIKEIKDQKLHLFEEKYNESQLNGIDLVVAATNCKDINQKIKKDCKRKKIICNRSDDPDDSDFIFPSVCRRGDLSISVCTEGASPFLTKEIMSEIKEMYDEEYIERLELLRESRKIIRLKNFSEDEKRCQLKMLTEMTIEKLRETVIKLNDDA